MDAVEYMKALHRMCIKSRDCNTCPIYKCTGKKCLLPYSSDVAMEEQVKIVDEWAKACPERTRQSVFLERYPNAKADEDGSIGICPTVIEGKNCNELSDGTSCCKECRSNYWSQEVQDE